MISIKTTSFLIVLLLAQPGFAQDGPAAGVFPTEVATPGQWTPLGPPPVDQAGAGLRGYGLPGESTQVTAPGGDQVSIHAVAANNFYREQNATFSITQRYETHTLALGYRHGFRFGMFPRFELGGQVQVTQGGDGFMNGFILGVEKLVVRMTGAESARNPSCPCDDSNSAWRTRTPAARIRSASVFTSPGGNNQSDVIPTRGAG